MSHFSTIKTKITKKPALLEALEILQYDVQEDHLLINPIDHNHEKVKVDVAIGNDIGFRLNEVTGVYELVADLQTWDHPIPPKRFIEKVTQQYARMTIHNQIKEDGWQVAEEWEMDDNSIELVVTRWN
jgi:hypothetical protein|tara:strand:- start:459 stop:842 length:384 start_codon:yes stop_codon:yes gene_type:complete